MRKRKVFCMQMRKRQVLSGYIADSQSMIGKTYGNVAGEAEGKKGKYTPGVYTTNLALNDNNVKIRVEVDENRINSITMVNLDETVATMFQLLQPTFDQIARHIYEKQSLDDFSHEEESKHTSKVLLKAIQEALDQAAYKEE